MSYDAIIAGFVVLFVIVCGVFEYGMNKCLIVMGVWAYRVSIFV